MTAWETLTSEMPAIEIGQPGDDDDRIAWPAGDEDVWRHGVQEIADAAMDVELTPSDEESGEERALVPAGLSLPPAVDRAPAVVPVCRRGALIEQIVEWVTARLAPVLAAVANLRAEWQTASYEPRHAAADEDRDLKERHWSPLKAWVRLRLSPTRWDAARDRLAALRTVTSTRGAES